MFTFIAATVAAFAIQNAPAAAQPTDAGHTILLALVQPSVAAPRLADALTSDQPTVRAAAARVIATNNDGSLIPRLVETLRTEKDDLAAAEQVRALLLLQGAPALAIVDPHVDRVGGRAAIALAEWLARHRPALLAPRLATLAPLIPRGQSFLPPLVVYAARDSDARAELLRAWMPHSAPLGWKNTLHGVLRTDEDLENAAPILLEGLRSPNSDVRDDTVWFLVAAVSVKKRLPDAVEKAVVSSTPVADLVDWEQFGRELIARRSTTSPFPDRAAFLKTKGAANRRLSDPSMVSLLSRKEADEVRAAFPTTGRFGSGWFGPPPEPITSRTIPEWMPGIIGLTAAAAGCSVPATLVAGYARVTYDETGRPVKVSVDHSELAAPCRPILEALVRTSLADADKEVTVSIQQWQVLPLSRVFVECSVGSVKPLPVGSEAGDGPIKTPRKIRDVRPTYPDQLQKARVEGMVIADAVISERGCVTAIRVLKTSGALLFDLSAIRAVSGWGFEPVTVGGKPVPVIMTVTTNFSLR